MRYLLTVLMVVATSSAFSQNDFPSLDKKSYDYYLQGDYRNLKATADTMLAQGMDYYYLRMRLGILAYYAQDYAHAVTHFDKAIVFSPLDTVSRGYIYSSYVLSGRVSDAGLYLKSLTEEQKNCALKAIQKPEPSDFFVGAYISSSQNSDQTNSSTSQPEERTTVFATGVESHLSDNLKLTLAYTYFQRTRNMDAGSVPEQIDLDAGQNQLYAKVSRYAFAGWELTGFAHVANYNSIITPVQPTNSDAVTLKATEYLAGLGIGKNGWKIRTGANASASNFSSSTQIRGEGYLTYLPGGNLNFYLTTGGMVQTDKNWGNTYQANFEIGLKTFQWFWAEIGTIKGNSYLYARNQGFAMNNSFQIPTCTNYINLHFLPGKQFKLSLMGSSIKNAIYLWDLNNYTRSNNVTYSSLGASVKLIYYFK